MFNRNAMKQNLQLLHFTTTTQQLQAVKRFVCHRLAPKIKISVIIIVTNIHRLHIYFNDIIIRINYIFF